MSITVSHQLRDRRAPKYCRKPLSIDPISDLETLFNYLNLNLNIS